LLGTLILVRDHYTPASSPTTEAFSAAPQSLLSTLHSVPQSVYDAVGVASPANPITPLRPTSKSGNAPMWLASVDNGPPEPVVFFYGAEFAPYAAAQRWPLILALSRFGSFRQLGLMQSSQTTAFANVSTFTFYDSFYSSPYVVLEPLDVANRWVLNASSFSPGALVGLSQDQIAGDLSSPQSPLTQAVVAAANEITASICSVDGQKPDNVCSSRGVVAADQVLKITPPA
jgi:hypothetical protein